MIAAKYDTKPKSNVSKLMINVKVVVGLLGVARMMIRTRWRCNRVYAVIWTTMPKLVVIQYFTLLI